MTIFSIEWWGYVLGGLGLFLIGLTTLGDGLKKIAGNRLKILLDKYTSKPWQGVLMGASFTVIIQSSSATTALVIGLIKAGLMTLSQAIGVIMGANIGTTVTAFLIGLKISAFAPFILVTGSFIYLLANRLFTRHLGEILFGFGALFFGLTLMETSLKTLATLAEFQTFVSTLNTNPLMSMLVGLLGTAAIQSSSAFIGILQGIYSATSHTSAELSLMSILPLLYGANIGTTITAIMASLGGSVSSRRAAAVHFFFNLIGATLFLILLVPYASFIAYLSSLWNLDPKMQIAVAHIFFNVITTLLIFPFIHQFQRFIIWLVPGKDNALAVEIDLHELERDVIEISPTTGLEIAKRQSLKLGELAIEALRAFIRFLNSNNLPDRDRVYQYEATIDQLYEKLSDFLNSMRKTVLEERDLLEFVQVLRIIKDIERLGDHCENLIEFMDESIKRGEKLNDLGREDIVGMLQFSEGMIKNALDSYRLNDYELAKKVVEQDVILDEMEQKNRLRHLNRFVDGVAESNRYLAMVFVDILANIERLGDHAVNIADTVIDRYLNT